MLYSYVSQGLGLVPQPQGAVLADAIWIDLYRPLESQVRAVSALGYDVPTLADMEEIEISSRLYTDNGRIYMTAVLPGQLPDGTQVAMPVTFILDQHRLVTVRHHAPRPFETFPPRADRSSSGCGSPARVFLGLIEDIVGRLADLSEGVARALDATAAKVLTMSSARDAGSLQVSLVTVGRQAELMSRVRMGLLSMERILAYHAANSAHQPDSSVLRPLHGALQRDIQALEVHADFLGSRIAMTVDATMGMIGLQQNDRVRILSVVAALFLPPTLIASIYGMNFSHMPELELTWGFPMALGLMVGSAVVTFLVLKWKNWL
ncbi:magnesium transporter [Paracoccus aminovorans]|uniref:Magnesium transporter n=1 Tax=Paracoccus aminovorans TaxID=34004 RepID=A0A1I2X3T2_9RHOB|nr:magnesium transporter CorA family protein [Paracoccus aminovorans]CQR85490.1 magnesium/cobalt transport protein [Paracoccus aminovorans]SFH08180.1 magnesium transporter [Paracoccus aminovorans]